MNWKATEKKMALKVKSFKWRPGEYEKTVMHYQSAKGGEGLLLLREQRRRWINI